MLDEIVGDGAVAIIRLPPDDVHAATAHTRDVEALDGLWGLCGASPKEEQGPRERAREGPGKKVRKARRRTMETELPGRRTGTAVVPEEGDAMQKQQSRRPRAPRNEEHDPRRMMHP